MEVGWERRWVQVHLSEPIAIVCGWMAVAGAKDMERSEQTGENVRSGDHRAWCWVGCGKTRRAKVMPGLLACLTQTVMVLPTGLVDPGEGQNREG